MRLPQHGHGATSSWPQHQNPQETEEGSPPWGNLCDGENQRDPDTSPEGVDLAAPLKHKAQRRRTGGQRVLRVDNSAPDLSQLAVRELRDGSVVSVRGAHIFRPHK